MITCSRCHNLDTARCPKNRTSLDGEGELALKECFTTTFGIGDIIEVEEKPTETFIVKDLTLKPTVVSGNWVTSKKDQLVPEGYYVLEGIGDKHLYNLPFCGAYGFVRISHKKEEIDINKYPHVCRRCGSPAYEGLNDVDCSKCGRY